MKTQTQMCPRCWGEMESPRLALSRLTRGEHDERLYVCPDCGVAEALEEYYNGVVNDWRKEPF